MNTDDLSQFENVNLIYREKIKSRSQQIQFEKNMAEKPGLRMLQAKHEGATLSVALDDQSIVVDVSHSGFKNPLRCFVDAFCENIKGKSLQEAAEHGLVRLDYALRNENSFSDKIGLFNAERAEPFLKIVNQLVREIFHQFLNLNSENKIALNYWRDQIPQFWIEKTEAEKIKTISEALPPILVKISLQNDAIEIVKIRHETRVVISIKAQQTRVGHSLIKIERELQKQTGLALELQLESLEDRNKRIERTQRA
jgi:NifU-like protein involved in Fe-S cluster formation